METRGANGSFKDANLVIRAVFDGQTSMVRYLQLWPQTTILQIWSILRRSTGPLRSCGTNCRWLRDFLPDGSEMAEAPYGIIWVESAMLLIRHQSATVQRQPLVRGCVFEIGVMPCVIDDLRLKCSRTSGMISPSPPNSFDVLADGKPFSLTTEANRYFHCTRKEKPPNAEDSQATHDYSVFISCAY